MFVVSDNICLSFAFLHRIYSLLISTFSLNAFSTESDCPSISELENMSTEDLKTLRKAQFMKTVFNAGDRVSAGGQMFISGLLETLPFTGFSYLVTDNMSGNGHSTERQLERDGFIYPAKYGGAIGNAFVGLVLGFGSSLGAVASQTFLRDWNAFKSDMRLIWQDFYIGSLKASYSKTRDTYYFQLTRISNQQAKALACFVNVGQILQIR